MRGGGLDAPESPAAAPTDGGAAFGVGGTDVDVFAELRIDPMAVDGRVLLLPLFVANGAAADGASDGRFVMRTEAVADETID